MRESPLLLVALALFCCLSSSAQAQNHLGHATADVNFRPGPGQSHTATATLSPGEALFLFSLEKENGYYHVIRIATDEEGYVHSDYVEVDQELPRSTEPLFTPQGASKSEQPEIEIQNDTDLTLTLVMNELRYSFSPRETRTIAVPVGGYDCRASAPGVIPYTASEQVEPNMSYSWTFYIVTVRQ